MLSPIHKIDRYDVLREFAISLLQKNELTDLCWVIADSIGQLPGFEDSVVYLKQGEDLVQVAAFGMKAADREIVEPIRIPVGEGIVGTVAQNAASELIADTTLDDRYIPDCYPGRSELTVPVVYQGEVIAVLDTEHARPNAYTTEHLEILQAMADVSAPRIGSAIVEEQKKAAAQELERLNAELERRVEKRTQQLAMAASQAETERQQLATILNVLHDGLIVVDSDNRIVLASQSAGRVLEVAESTLAGELVADVLCIRETEDVVGWITQGLQCDDDREATLLLADGTAKEIQVNVARLPGSETDARGLVITFRDVTQQNFLQRQNEQLTRMQSLGILAGGIAHDFNNNLTAILGAIECIALEGTVADDGPIAIARTACDNSAQLTKQLLGYAKGGDPVRKPASLEEIIRTSATLATLENRATLTVDLEESLPAVMVDPGQITQVFSNIFLNSVQAMENGGTVSVRAAANEHGMVETTIADSGPGFSDSLERVFEPYFTGRSDGSGLGLTTCYFMIQRHGGTISASNAPTGGAELRFTLPIALGKVERKGEDVTAAARPSGLRVLVLEDDALVAESIRLMLQQDDHDIVIVQDGDQLLRLMGEDNDFAFALLDLQIRNGRGGAEIVSELKTLTKMPCIAVSGYSNSASVSDPTSHGFDAAIAKPFSISEFYETVIPLLD